MGWVHRHTRARAAAAAAAAGCAPLGERRSRRVGADRRAGDGVEGREGGEHALDYQVQIKQRGKEKPSDGDADEADGDRPGGGRHRGGEGSTAS